MQTRVKTFHASSSGRRELNEENGYVYCSRTKPAIIAAKNGRTMAFHLAPFATKESHETIRHNANFLAYTSTMMSTRTINLLGEVPVSSMVAARNSRTPGMRPLMRRAMSFDPHRRRHRADPLVLLVPHLNDDIAGIALASRLVPILAAERAAACTAASTLSNSAPSSSCRDGFPFRTSK